ncbi:hypothetical protein [Amycolatopsis azurea]|uniref:Uncharacterized protein n=1 Tax=Amycolatopsis azurea DSM 43854 TaxID=1238180 RepID=A0ABX3J7I5_9PSEU|nr:hypothetical protein [Amycolatopsis azurea]OOC03655.1 hypothetical protein B0293_25585 [Amycolatopsis azurea DSM 43854]
MQPVRDLTEPKTLLDRTGERIETRGEVLHQRSSGFGPVGAEERLVAQHRTHPVDVQPWNSTHEPSSTSRQTRPR